MCSLSKISWTSGHFVGSVSTTRYGRVYALEYRDHLKDAHWSYSGFDQPGMEDGVQLYQTPDGECLAAILSERLGGDRARNCRGFLAIHGTPIRRAPSRMPFQLCELSGRDAVREVVLIKVPEMPG